MEPPKFLLLLGDTTLLAFPFDVFHEDTARSFMLLGDEISDLTTIIKSVKLNGKAVFVVVRNKEELQLLDTSPQGSTPNLWTCPGLLEIQPSSIPQFESRYHKFSLHTPGVGAAATTQMLLARLQGASKNPQSVTDLTNWGSIWFAKPKAHGTPQGYQMMSKFINWELKGAFNYPHPKQSDDLCWLFTICDHLEALYNINHPGSPPNKLSKQYILDYIPVDHKIPPPQIGEAFAYNLHSVYMWAAGQSLVLDDDYYPFVETKQAKRPVKVGSQVKINRLIRHEGYEESEITSALKKFPVAASLWMKHEDVLRVYMNPRTPYYVDDDGGRYKTIKQLAKEIGSGNRHAVVLSGMTTSALNKLNFLQNTFFVKDFEWLVPPKSRFNLKRQSALLKGELNPLLYVVYPEEIRLE